MALSIAFVLTASARADEDRETKRAQDYLRAGVRRFESGATKEALAAFKRGQEHKALPELSYRLGECYRKLGDNVAAAREYRVYLAKMPGAPERAELEKFLSSGDAPALEKRPAVDAKPGATPDGNSQTTANVKCPEGRSVTLASNGHCCWPEQIWGDEKGVCLGIPRCPRGFEVAGRECARKSTAEPEVCYGGKVTTAGHCCWPEQVWGIDAAACIGTPRCPRGLVVNGVRCVPHVDEDE